jgi:hypothetical protein
MGLLRVIVAALTFSLATAFAAADPALEDMAVRTELIPIQTLTLSDSQFLTGDVNVGFSANRVDGFFPRRSGRSLCQSQTIP